MKTNRRKAQNRNSIPRDAPSRLAETLSASTEFQPITPHGDEGFVTAAVVDPFGNVLGVMTNPHYLEILAGGPRA